MEDGQHTGEAAFLRFSEDQRYYYLSQQRIDEVTLLFMGGFDPKDPSDKLMGKLLIATWPFWLAIYGANIEEQAPRTVRSLHPVKIRMHHRGKALRFGR